MRRRLLLRASVSIGLLAGLAWWLDLGTVASRLVQMRPVWVLLAVAISVVQVAVLAWRWRFTAGCLGVRLSFSAAWREYYLSIFLNQVLPGGVAGDVSRAWRQARAPKRWTGFSRQPTSSSPTSRRAFCERQAAIPRSCAGAIRV